MLSDMAAKKKPQPPLGGLVVPAHRTCRVIFRITDAEDTALRALAERAGIGPSTLARLIIEQYLTKNALTRE